MISVTSSMQGPLIAQGSVLFSWKIWIFFFAIFFSFMNPFTNNRSQMKNNTSRNSPATRQTGFSLWGLSGLLWRAEPSVGLLLFDPWWFLKLTLGRALREYLQLRAKSKRLCIQECFLSDPVPTWSQSLSSDLQPSFPMRAHVSVFSRFNLIMEMEHFLWAADLILFQFLQLFSHKKMKVK